MRPSGIQCSIIMVMFLSICINAYDTKGKFGMGIRCYGAPIIMFSTMKIGVSNAVSLEPSIGYYRYSSEYSYTDIDYLGNDVLVTEKFTNSLYDMSIMLDMKPLRYEKSNFIVKTGASYVSVTSSYKYDNEGNSHSSGAWAVMVLGGIGVEHFVTHWFSVNAGILSGYCMFKDKKAESPRYSIGILSSQLADFALIWYLK